MNSTELLDLFRSELSDLERPYLWSDDQVFGYIDDAQKMFCRLTEGIADASTVATELEVSIGDDWVDLHPAIKTVRAVVRADTGKPIELLNQEDMALRQLRFDGVAGPVVRLIIGMEDSRVRLHPVSSEAVTLQMTIFRLPLEDITADGDQAFEIAAEHHPHLLMWVKSRAYGKQDSETTDKTKKAEFEAEFRAYCEAVKNEQTRKRHKPRSVAYGGL